MARDDKEHRIRKEIYTALDSETSIRILELLPGHEVGAIQCQLRVVQRRDAPSYEALSYTWGSPEDKVEIFCHGTQVKVPRSLYEVLQRVRHRSEVRMLWADAICINQSDKTEVGHQVRQMGSIYSEAKRVLIWLGTEDLFHAFSGEESVTMILQRALKELEVGDDQRASTSDDPDAATAFSNPDVWSSFAALSRLPYFTRLWVVQEVGLARSGLVLFGTREIDAEYLIRLYLKIQHYHPTVYQAFELETLNAFEIFPTKNFAINQTENTAASSEGYDFLDVLFLTRFQRAFDPRDYIFALLGHPSAMVDGTLIIEPNYKKTDKEIFHELTMTLLQQNKSLRVLCAALHTVEDDLIRDHPSWMPTWIAFRSSLYGTAGVLQSDRSLFDADAGIPARFDFSDNKKILRVQGFVFDMVDECTSKVETMPGSRTITRWPIQDVLAFKAWSSISTEQKLHKMLRTLTDGGLERRVGWEQAVRDFAAFRVQLSKATLETAGYSPQEVLPEGQAEAQELAVGGDAQRFISWSQDWILNHRLFSTRSGMLGLGPPLVRSGDFCCILFGSWMPLLLRPVESRYRLVGDAYIPQVVQGEAVVDFRLGEKYPEQTFEIF